MTTFGPTFGVLRSGQWATLAKLHLRSFPDCAACGSTAGCVPHHIIPVHVNPEMECDRSNLLTMCPRCHLFVGHLGNWASWNNTAEYDAMVWREKIKKRPFVERLSARMEADDNPDLSPEFVALLESVASELGIAHDGVNRILNSYRGEHESMGLSVYANGDADPDSDGGTAGRTGET